MDIQVEDVQVEVRSGGGNVNPVNTTTAPVETNSKFTGSAGNAQNDLKALAEEMAVHERANKMKTEIINATPKEVAQEAPQPEQPATAPTIEVPEKFKDSEGNVVEERIAKSTVHAEEAYQKYLDIERKLREKQREVNAIKNGQPIQVAPAQVPATPQLSPFEIQVAQDLINEAAALGYQMPQAQAIAQAKIQVRLLEAKHSAEQSMVENLRNRLDEADRKEELKGIKETDPWILSPEGIETLSKIRETRPHVNNSPTPWTAAYREYLADTVLQQRLAGQVSPTPTSKTVKAPPTPVNVAPKVVVKSNAPTIESMSSDQISEYVKGLSPQEEAKFWKSRGLKF